MDKASDFESEDCRFESCRGRSFTFVYRFLIYMVKRLLHSQLANNILLYEYSLILPINYIALTGLMLLHDFDIAYYEFNVTLMLSIKIETTLHYMNMFLLNYLTKTL